MLSNPYKNWRHDLIAGITVALVALPLGLGIAIASDAPPMAGITSAIAGGPVATWFRGSHVAINGPAKSLIIVVAAGLAQLKTGVDPLTALSYWPRPSCWWGPFRSYWDCYASASWNTASITFR